jgi:tRNA(Ile)-lysidine synthase
MKGRLFSNQMISKVKTFCQEEGLLGQNDNIIIGLSSGADSVCLLCVLLELVPAKQLLAVHINHSIRETAERDQEFARKLCQDKGLAFKTVKVDAITYAKEHGLSTEEAGRLLRYQAFEEVGKEHFHGSDFKVAIAHNMDDNAETVLLNLFRGTGIKGISGIRSSRDNIIRPLLCIKRTEIEAYLSSIGQDYCNDETNFSDDYTRNKIRHHILPLAKEEINPRAVERVFELSNQAESLYDFIEEETAKAASDIAKVEAGQAVIKLEHWGGYHDYIKRSVVLDILSKVAGSRKDITTAHIESVIKLMDLQVGREVSLPYSMVAKRVYEGIKVVREAAGEYIASGLDEELVLKEGENSFEGSIISMEVESNIINNNEIPVKNFTKWADYDRISNSLVVRHRRRGAYITINDEGQTKKLKSYFVDEKIPSEVRNKVLLIADGSHIVWIIGYRLGSYYKVTERTNKILKLVFKGE